MADSNPQLGLAGELLAFLIMVVLAPFLLPYIERWQSFNRRETAAFILGYLFWGSMGAMLLWGLLGTPPF